MKGQSRVASLIEAKANVLSGFLVSLLVWIYVVQPLWGLSFQLHDNLAITGIFTISSILRSYIWRRVFNWRDIRHSRRKGTGSYGTQSIRKGPI